MNIIQKINKVAMFPHPKHPQVEATLHIRSTSNSQLSIAALPKEDPEKWPKPYSHLHVMGATP